MANYNIRNVAEKEIYDSYMGIMRISPNLSNPLNENSKLIDDPTTILNSLISINPLTKNQSQTEVILSDSDGNILPITFIPKAKRTTVVIERVEKTIPLINIVTKINDEAKLYIEENFKSYSTIWIDNNEENDKIDAPSKISSLQIHTKSGIKENVLLYPIESPNDSSYFNNKNRLNLVDVQSSEYKPSQLKNELHKKDYSWYTEKFKEKPEKPIADENYDDENVNYAVDNYVSIDGKYVTTYNEKGELVPVLYTKDYVLGHYDGHSVNLNDNIDGVKSNWIGSNSRLHDNPSLSGATKLSWMRIDNLVWDIIESVLKGDLRHVKGRYQGLGAEENDDIMAALFEGGNCTLYDDPNGSDWLQKTAPMLGQGVQPGLILYNAMPFARYMFHVARQMCTNLLYQFGGVKDSWEIAGRDNDFNKVSEAIRIANIKELITPAPKAALSSVHSLVKDFLLCDGKEINYFNYPNINIANKNLFEIKSNELYPVPVNRTFKEIGAATTKSKLYNAMYKSRNDVFDTPHLYVLTEDAPRFIRGLNWSFDDSSNFDKYKGQEEVVSFNNASNNYGKITAGNNFTVNLSLTDEDIKNEDLRVTQDEFIYTANAIKNIKEVGLYFQNYDFKVKRGEHYHAEFSGESGMNSARDASTPYEEVNKTECVGYRIGEKSGATNYFANHENVLNHDKTNTCYGINDYSPNWINYCFGSHNKYDGYAPIPNGGLYLFNRRLYNDKDNSGYYGTTIDIENKINNGQFVYYDGENNAHRFEKITAETTIHNNFVDKIKENLNKNNISYVASELDAYKYVSNDNQASRRKKHEDFITFLLSGGYIDKLSSGVVAQCYEETFGQHHAEKERRRIMLTKINESEGRIPASARGGPYYRIGVVWSRTERRGVKKKRRKAYSYFWTNVGIYKISTNIEINNSAYKSEYGYRCLTGLPYSNRKKLGVGNLSASIESDWYSKNSVTTPINELSHKQISYGGENIQSNVMQNGLPTPDYLNLLPLIRI